MKVSEVLWWTKWECTPRIPFNIDVWCFSVYNCFDNWLSFRIMGRWTTRHLRIKPPPPRKKGEGGFLIFSDFDSEKLRVFILSKNPEQNCKWVFIYSIFFGRFAAGFLFWVFFIRESPLITPFSQNFPRASRAGSYLSQKNFARFARGFLFFSIFPKWPWVFILSNFDFLRNRSGFLFKGGFYSQVPGSGKFTVTGKLKFRYR